MQGIQKHCREEHGWTNKAGRGGNVRERSRNPPPRPWLDNQQCQRFFEYPKWKKYFRVETSVEASQMSTSDERNQRASQLGQDILDNYIQDIRDQEEQRRIEGSTSRYMPNPWLDFVGWEDHLKGFERRKLLNTIKPVAGEEVERQERQISSQIRSGETQDTGDTEEESNTEDEQNDNGLVEASRATRRLIKKAIAKCKPNIVGRSALEYVNRRETGAAKNEKPFYSGQRVQAIRKYSKVWVKMLRYIWRTARKENKPGYSLTSRQSRALDKLQSASRKIWDQESSTLR